MSKVIDKSGHGALVFVEDIDQVTRGNRDAAMQDILNTLDGGDTKDMNVITLFTTNHIDLIEPTFLRGKRIGTIISMSYLDAKTAERFIRESFKIGCYTISDDLTEVCKYIEQSNIAPAFMAEIVEKVKSIMILEDQCEVKAEYIQFSVASYLRQVSLSHTKNMSSTPEQRFAQALKEVLDIDKSTKDLGAFARMMEDYTDMDLTDFYK
jgi:transitional endoplasmic reticulum ATPase